MYSVSFQIRDVESTHGPQRSQPSLRGRPLDYWNPRIPILQISEHDKGWLEAAIDCEGSIGVYIQKDARAKNGFHYIPKTTISNTNLRLLEKFEELFPIGLWTIRDKRTRNPTHKTCYTLVFSNRLARAVLPRLKLIAKERQRILLLEFLELSIRNQTHIGRATPEMVWRRMTEIHNEMKVLNRVGRNLP